MSGASKILRGTAGGGIVFWCPGCDSSHQIAVGAGPGPRWSWNGDVHKPTFTPSIRTWWDEPSDVPGEDEDRSKDRPHVCHSYVTDGVIDFLGDCTHALRGKHPIPDWPRPDWGGVEPLMESTAWTS